MAACELRGHARSALLLRWAFSCTAPRVRFSVLYNVAFNERYIADAVVLTALVAPQDYDATLHEVGLLRRSPLASHLWDGLTWPAHPVDHGPPPYATPHSDTQASGELSMRHPGTYILRWENNDAGSDCRLAYLVR